jgi:hypothetical protein
MLRRFIERVVVFWISVKLAFDVLIDQADRESIYSACVTAAVNPEDEWQLTGMIWWWPSLAKAVREQRSRQRRFEAALEP